MIFGNSLYNLFPKIIFPEHFIIKCHNLKFYNLGDLNENNQAIERERNLLEEKLEKKQQELHNMPILIKQNGELQNKINTLIVKNNILIAKFKNANKK